MSMVSFDIPYDPGPLKDRDLALRLDEYAVHPVHKAPCYHFTMVHTGNAVCMGFLRLRIGSTPHLERYAGHVGYAVEEEHRGHRYAARSLALIVPLARKLGLDPLWITCDPDNEASRRTLEIAGAEFVEIVAVPEDCILHRTGHPVKCRYRL